MQLRRRTAGFHEMTISPRTVSVMNAFRRNKFSRDLLISLIPCLVIG